jgi:predicted RNase H-like nuclease (RuvC/YqgF family)
MMRKINENEKLKRRARRLSKKYYLRKEKKRKEKKRKERRQRLQKKMNETSVTGVLMHTIFALHLMYALLYLTDLRNFNTLARGLESLAI